jgi:DNA-binding CsgD family transcriptional regulator
VSEIAQSHSTTRHFLAASGLMARTVILYALALAAAAAALQWLQYRYLVHAFSTELYIGLIALGFVGLGLWAGRRLTLPRPGATFQRNDAAIRSLGLTPRECEILARLASGQSNKELARALGISPNTVKTHLANLFAKLEVERRIQAIEKARWLALIE